MAQINNLIESIKNIKVENLIELAIAISIAIIFKIISSWTAYIIIKIFNMRKKKEEIKKSGFYKPIKNFVFILGIYLGICILNIPQEVMNVITKIFKIIIILLVANGFGNCVTTDNKILKRIKQSDKHNLNTNTINFICKAIRFIIYLFAAFLIITELGYNIGSLVTALGIGSVVIALAVQDIAKSIIAGIMLLFDKPFSVGDYIQVGEVLGTVENISFRSTKIRTAEDTLVSIPNNIISEEETTNYAKMNKRKCTIDLSLTYDTTLEKAKKVIEKIKFMLKSNEHILKDSIQIHLDKIADNGIGINLYFYTDILQYSDYLDLKEQINFEILNILEQEKVELAYSTQTVYVKQENN